MQMVFTLFLSRQSVGLPEITLSSDSYLLSSAIFAHFLKLQIFP